MSEKEVPTIQILSKQDHAEQHLISLPNEKLLPLAPSSIRVKTTLFALSINNFSYARIGHLLGWWDAHPLPHSTPSPFNDSSKYGCTACWGYAKVLDSTTPSVKPGSQIFGYLPIGTLPIDKVIEDLGSNRIFETSPYRKHLLIVYNRYLVYPPDGPEQSETSQAWDAVMKTLFESSYNLNRFVFAWDPSPNPCVHPSGITESEWSAEDADIRDAVVLVFAPAGKTAASFAWGVRSLRPPNHQPRRLIGVGSEQSRQLSESFGWYDEVKLYDDDPVLVTESYNIDSKTKVVLVDFGARGTSGQKWSAALRPLCEKLLYVSVGTDPSTKGPEANTQGFLAKWERGDLQMNASPLRDRVMKAIGEKIYWEQFEETWTQFKSSGGIPGVNLEFGDGMDAAVSGWQRLADGKVKPETALVFRI